MCIELWNYFSHPSLCCTHIHQDIHVHVYNRCTNGVHILHLPKNKFLVYVQCMNTVHLCTHVLEQYLLCTLCIYTHILMYSDTLLKCALLIYKLNTCTRLVYSSTLLVVYTVHINTCTSVQQYVTCCLWEILL